MHHIRPTRKQVDILVSENHNTVNIGYTVHNYGVITQ